MVRRLKIKFYWIIKIKRNRPINWGLKIKGEFNEKQRRNSTVRYYN